jgi:hypothetical protein
MIKLCLATVLATVVQLLKTILHQLVIVVRCCDRVTSQDDCRQRLAAHLQNSAHHYLPAARAWEVALQASVEEIAKTPQELLEASMGLRSCGLSVFALAGNRI